MHTVSEYTNLCDIGRREGGHDEYEEAARMVVEVAIDRGTNEGMSSAVGWLRQNDDDDVEDAHVTQAHGHPVATKGGRPRDSPL